jgi:hypothetical protein
MVGEARRRRLKKTGRKLIVAVTSADGRDGSFVPSEPDDGFVYDDLLVCKLNHVAQLLNSALMCLD